MRSSKSRSRSKSNRPRPAGNNVNRVFDSSGPEGKVRGTPQQIIDKYLMLARDAQLGNDRVAELNFLQHAEHYTRMLSEAMRELAREQENRQAQNNNQGQHGSQGQNNNGQGGNQGGDANQGQPQSSSGQQGGQSGEHRGGHQRRERRDNRNSDATAGGPSADVIDMQDDEGSGLVETPEARREPRRAPRQPAQPTDVAADAPEAAKPARAPRPRRPRGEAQDVPKPDGEPSAAE